MFCWTIDDHTELRLLEMRHAPELFALTDRNRQYLANWLPWMHQTRTVQDTEEFLHAALKQHAANQGFHCGIWHNGEISGTVGLHVIDWPNRNVSLGYWVSQHKQGRGIVTKSTRAVVDHCFQELDLHRVEIRCGLENHRSRAIPVRLGFREEGVLRHAQWLGDRFADMVIYGKLATDPVA
jgi:ribosomal-protein-serine acetyltransferase